MKAVFFGDYSYFTAAHMRGWLSAGHDIVAFVAPEGAIRRRRHRESKFSTFAPQWSVGALLDERTIPTVSVNLPMVKSSLLQDLAGIEADILLSVAFMGRISQDVISAFPYGALNVHPAMLPAYRGPAPSIAMAFDNAPRSEIGITIHAMTDAFDEGPILAQGRLTDIDNCADNMLEIENSRLGAWMLPVVIDQWIAGDRQFRDQPEGDFPTGRVEKDAHFIRSGMPLDDLKRVLSLERFRIRPRIRIEHRVVVLTDSFNVIGEPTGVEPVASLFSVELDTQEARVRVRRSLGVARRISDRRRLLRFRRHSPIDGDVARYETLENSRGASSV